jgi:hypothetical protein
MKRSRELILMARANLSVDRIAARLDTFPMSVEEAARRLGTSVGQLSVKRDG